MTGSMVSIRLRDVAAIATEPIPQTSCARGAENTARKL